jgi:molecular chaperone DnaJ
MGWFGRQQQTRRDESGEDIQYDLKITFAESFSGIKKDISFDRMTNCETCDGHGTKDGKEPKTCTQCRWSGYVTKATRSIFGMMQQTVICVECHGEWSIIEHPCSECHGKRRIKKKVSQIVEIPAGIDDGMTIRMNNEGHAGKHNNGDLYIVCHVEQSQDGLLRRGNDLHSTVKISPAEAVLWVNKKVRFPLLGEREIRIAAGTQHGKKIQLTSEWMPIIGKKWHGDLIITLVILIPEKISKAEKILYESIKKAEK